MIHKLFFIPLVLFFAIGRVAAQTAVTEPACFGAIDPLIKQGQSEEALARLDTCLAGNEDNPQGLLLKGRALFQAQHIDKALATFQQLAQMRPDSATAQNNLGVLHTRLGHLIDARTALEKAVVLSPRFAIAHENLADVHVRLARLSYGLAAQSADEKSTTRVLHKLARISEPKDSAGNKGDVVTRLLPVTATVAVPDAAAPVVPDSLQPKAPLPFGASERETAAANTAPTAVVHAGPVAVPVAPEVTSPKASSAIGELTGAATAANVARAWAQAWSAGDFDAYLNFYDETFTPEGGKNRTLWEAERRQRVTGRHDIRVEVSAVDVRALGSQSAEVRFLQVYTSSIHSDRGIKILRLVLRGETWKIVKESFLQQSAIPVQR